MARGDKRPDGTPKQPRAPRSPKPRFLAQGEGKAIWFLGTLVTVKASGEDLGGALSLVEMLHRPGFATPMHVHADADELFYILEGEETIICGDRTYRAGPGCFAILPRGMVHGYRVEGTSPSRHLTVALPAGFESFVEAVGTPARERALPPAEPLDLPRLKAEAAKRNMEVVGPPPT